MLPFKKIKRQKNKKIKNRQKGQKNTHPIDLIMYYHPSIGFTHLGVQSPQQTHTKRPTKSVKPIGQ
jgi:hypothetical protein